MTIFRFSDSGRKVMGLSHHYSRKGLRRHFFANTRYALLLGARRFNSLVERGVDSETISYTMLIDRFSKEGIVEKTFGVLKKMVNDGLKPSLVTYTAIVLGFCRKGKLDEAFDVFKRVKDLGIEVDEFMYATLVDGLCTRGEFDSVFHLLEEMEEKGINPSVVTYNTLINGLCKFGRTSEAGEMSKNIPGDIITYSTLLHGYIEEENISGIMEIKLRLEDAGVGMDIILCNILLKALFMIGAVEDAYALFKEMPGMNLVPNPVTYCTMIDGSCKTGRIDKALEIFDEFRRTSISSVACYNSIINGLCKKDMVDLATKVYFELKEKGLTLDAGICMMLIKAIFRKESAEGVLHFVYGVEHLEPDIYGYIFNNAISFLCKKKFPLAASEVYVLIKRKGSIVTCKSYYAILKGLIGCGKKWLSLPFMSTFLKEYGIFESRVCKILLYYMCLHSHHGKNALCSLYKIGTSNLTFPVFAFKALISDGKVLDVYRIVMTCESNLPVMDVVDYSIIADELCKGGYPREALDLCTFAEKKGIILNIVTYNSIINGLCCQDCLVEAFRLFDSLARNNLIPSEVTYATLIHSLCKEGFLPDAHQLYERMVLQGYKPNTRVYNSFIDSYCKCGQVDEALKLLNIMEINRLNPDEFTVSFVINGFCQKSDMEAALEFFSEYKRKAISPDFLGFLYLVRGLCIKGRMEEARSVLREMLLSQSVVTLINRVDAEVETESVESILVFLCEQGSIKEALGVLNEIASMFFPVQKYNAYNVSDDIHKHYESMVGSGDSVEETSRFNYLDYYSLITSFCARGEVRKANSLAKEMLSSLKGEQ
ncbi:pentatricopeptide repeat-containing protein At5g57250, mitochondrial [Tripterygium wilfordii]|uniref:pentatricopeptide repeat-containing protein At5g57250, mitochondrial n=1 Tax=Tripterygium wilfordii TaxID=458696 RepID=UPI0018F80CEF|nr:pentatricopeptide repeat-containing protein At5g57250, mitochondrial [Tripterygium wilfordii]